MSGFLLGLSASTSSPPHTHTCLPTCLFQPPAALPGVTRVSCHLSALQDLGFLLRLGAWVRAIVVMSSLGLVWFAISPTSGSLTFFLLCLPCGCLGGPWGGKWVQFSALLAFGLVPVGRRFS